MILSQTSARTEPTLSKRERVQGTTGVVIGALGNLGPTWVDTYNEMFDRVVAVVQTNELAQAVEVFSDLPRVHVDSIDVTNHSRVMDLASRLGRDTGLVDALVLNAGIDVPPERGQTSDLTEPVLDVNLRGALYTLNAFSDFMSHGGAIVFIGSMYADLAPRPSNYAHLSGFVKHPIYGATKAACLSLVRQYAGLWGARGIRVNMLSPGGIDSGQDLEFIRQFRTHVPLGRMGRPDELAGALRFLSGPSSTYVTGINLPVDGGVHVW